jgi:hypothetical protein
MCTRGRHPVRAKPSSLVSEERVSTAGELLASLTSIQGDSPMALKTVEEWIVELGAVGFFTATRTMARLDGTDVNLKTIDFTDVRPRNSIQLWRVCNPGRERSIFWSNGLETLVKHFVPEGNRWGINHNEAHLYSAVVDPDRIFAIVQDWEWIIDPRGLNIHDHGQIEKFPMRPKSRVRDMPDSPQRTHLIAEGLGDQMVFELPDTDVWLQRKEVRRGELLRRLRGLRRR